MKTILITGGAGFNWQCAGRKLLQNSDNFVIIVDNLTTGEIGKLPDAPKERMQLLIAT